MSRILSSFFSVIVFALMLAACGEQGGNVTGGGGSSSTASSGGGGGATGGGTAVLASAYVLSWGNVSDPSVTGYRAYYSTTPLATGKILGTVDTTGTSLEFVPSDHGMAKGEILYMAVSALGVNGLESPVSDEVSVIVE